MRKYIPAIALAVMFIGLYIVMSVVLIYNSYGSTAFDLGLFVEMLKTTIHGHMLVISSTGFSQLGSHFSPILFMLVPIYWVFHYAQTLLVVQSVLVGVTGILVYYVARYFKLSDRMSLFIELLYLFSPLTWGIVLFNFHEICFALPLLFIMSIGLLKKNWWMFGVTLALSLMIKEDITATVIVFGISMLVFTYFKQKKISKVALIIVVFGIAMFGIGLLVSAMISRGEPKVLKYILPSDSISFRYNYFNSSFSQGLFKFGETVLSGWSILLVLYFLLPLYFLPLGTIEWAMPALFILTANVVSTCYQQHSQLNQYSAGAIPFLFVAGIMAVAKSKWQNIIKNNRYKVIAVSVILIIFSVGSSFLVENRGNLLRVPTLHDKAVDNVISQIPNGATVTACDNIEPHLIAKYDAYLCPELAADGLVGGLIYGAPFYNTEYVVVDNIIVENTGWEDTIRNDSDYTLVYQLDGCQLYQRRNIE